MPTRYYTPLEHYLYDKYLYCNYQQLGGIIKAMEKFRLSADYPVKFYDASEQSSTYRNRLEFWESILFRYFKRHGGMDFDEMMRLQFKVDLSNETLIVRHNGMDEGDNSFEEFYSFVYEKTNDSDNAIFVRACTDAEKLVQDYLSDNKPGYRRTTHDYRKSITEKADDRRHEDRHRQENVRPEEPKKTVPEPKTNPKNNESEENSSMKNIENLIPGLKIGKIADGSVKMSHLGIAVKNADGTYVSYDRNNECIVDVDIVSFDGDSFLFYMPVMVSDIKVNDTILHNGKACYVTAVQPRLKAISLADGCTSDVMVTTNLFGFNFVTKIMSLIDFTAMNGGDPSGNMMWPLLLAAKDGNESDDNNDMLTLTFMMQMSQQNGGNIGMGNMFSNPLMLYALLGNSSGNDNLKLIMLMQMFQQQAQPKVVTAAPEATPIPLAPAVNPETPSDNGNGPAF